MQQVVVAAIVQFNAADRLRMTAIQTLRESKDGRQRAHGASRPPLQIAESIVVPFWCCLTMIACDQGNLLDFVGLETAQIAVAD
jgi:hypothetical protein